MKEQILNEIINNSMKLMDCVTIKENYEEFEKAFDIIKNELSDYYIKEIMVGNYKNLVISNTNDKDLDIIFCAHVDVVTCNEYKGIIKDNKLYGRGAFDMKGQLSVLMSLFKNNKSNKKIALIITSDEEIGGYCCKKIMEDYNSKLAVIPDAGKNFELVVEEKGLFQLELKIKGISAHASEPFSGENAIVKLFNVYKKLLKIYPMPLSKDDFKTSINLSKLNGGITNNMVPDEATMVLDIRFTNEDSITKIISDIKNISEEIIINILDEGPTFYVDSKLDVIKDFINNSSKILNKDIKISKCLATSDAIYFSEKNIPTILMNPVGDYWHNPKEYVEIDSLYTLYEIFKTLI